MARVEYLSWAGRSVVSGLWPSLDIQTSCQRIHRRSWRRTFGRQFCMVCFGLPIRHFILNGHQIQQKLILAIIGGMILPYIPTTTQTFPHGRRGTTFIRTSHRAPALLQQSSTPASVCHSKIITDKELAVNFDFDASLKSDVDLFTTMVPALEKQAQAALFDETLAKEYLPDMKITWIACPQTTWTLAWGKVVVERRYEEHVKQNHQIRPIRFTEIEGANHFVSISVYGPHSWVVDMFAGSLGRAAEILENCCRNC